LKNDLYRSLTKGIEALSSKRVFKNLPNLFVAASAFMFWLLRNMAKTLLFETAFVTVTFVAPGVLTVRGSGD
jgi:hypothetical protein